MLLDKAVSGEVLFDDEAVSGEMLADGEAVSGEMLLADEEDGALSCGEVLDVVVVVAWFIWFAAADNVVAAVADNDVTGEVEDSCCINAESR